MLNSAVIVLQITGFLCQSASIKV